MHLRLAPAPIVNATIVALLSIAASTAAWGEIDPELLAGMKARSIGPAGMSGRTAVVASIPGTHDVIYVGAATGGVWKSENGGLSFEPIFDEQKVASIGALAIDPTNPDVIWVGTGEGNPRNSASVGNGIYKSIDGGRSWTHLGLDKSERIHRIHIHPQNPDVVYAAAMGPAWGEGEERGVYKTVDGGATWERVLFVNEKTGCADLVVDPVNPDKLIAAMWEFRRWPWFFESGGAGSGIFLSYDGGASWERLTQEDGLPKGDLGRIGLAVAPSSPEIVYALVEAEKNVMMRSDDGGHSFEVVGKSDNIGNRPFYYADLRVDPERPDRVYSLWSLVSVSDDGGQHFRVLMPWSTAHPDHHAMWIDPTDPNFIINGNDGGVYISRDRGESWRFVSNLPVGQFYHIAVDDDVPYNIYGGMQDNGSWRGPSSVWENGGIRNHHWDEVGFGDGFDCRPHPMDSTIGYAMSQEGFLMRWDLVTGERKSIRPAPATDDEKLRFNWNPGFAQDPFDTDTIYFGSQYLHRSNDRGDTWTVISGDLTTNNPEWQKQDDSGGLTPDVTGAENFVSIVAIAPSPVESGVIWVGTDDGRVQVTRDGGQTWTSVEDRVKGVPENTWVPHIDPSPHDPSIAHVVFEDHRRSNWTPYVYRAEEYGQKWRSLATDDLWGYCLVVAQDPVNPDLLFLGTEFALYFSTDAGRSWIHWTHGVPTVSVMDLVIQAREGDLVLGTHGRAAFVLDDISPLRTISDETMAEPVHLFPIPSATQHSIKQTGASRFPGETEFRGENRRYGAMITFSMNVDSLPHPDEVVEKERQVAKRDEERQEAEKEEAEGKSKKKGKKKAGEKGEPGVEGRPGGGEGRPGMKGKKKGPQVTVQVHDSQGDPIREFERPVHQGVNRIMWNFSSDPFEQPPRSGGGGGGFFDGERSGPEVLPGTYEVTLKYKDHEAKGSVEVRADPRASISMADRQAAWDAMQRAGALQETAAEAIQRIFDARKDVDFVLAKIKVAQRDEEDGDEEGHHDEAGDEHGAAGSGHGGSEAVEHGDDAGAEGSDDAEGDDVDAEETDPLKQLAKQGKELKKGLDELEERFRRPSDSKGIGGGDFALSRIRRGYWFIGSSWERPTPAALEYLARGERMLADILADQNEFFETNVKSFSDAVHASELTLFPEVKPLGVEE